MSNAYYVNPTTTQNTSFAAVKVTGGRKFRGRGFIVAIKTSSGSYGWRHTGFGWEHAYYETETAKIWVPELKRFQYANFKYVEDDASVSQAECDEQYRLYVEHTIQNTLDWCRSTKPDADAAEIARFARNVLRKNHPEMAARIDEVLPDQRNLRSEIEATIKWAQTLRTRPMWMYGRMTKGGKPYSNERYVQFARSALTKKGLAAKPEFEAEFKAACERAGLV